MDLQSTTIVILSLYKIVVEAKTNPSLKMKFLKIWFKKNEIFDTKHPKKWENSPIFIKF